MPTAIVLAVDFCFSDLLLITQCLYYNFVNARKSRKQSTRSNQTLDSAEQPLLNRRDSSIGLPGSHRRRSSAASRRHRASLTRTDSLTSIIEDSPSNEWWKNIISILAVGAVGTAGWAIAWKTRVWTPTSVDGGIGDVDTALGAQILGYASAICYLGYI